MPVLGSIDHCEDNCFIELLMPIRCWFVSGEDETDDFGKWKAGQPEFVDSDSEWFEQQFIATGELIDSDSDAYGCGGENLLLFRSHAAAELYGTRHAAIA